MKKLSLNIEDLSVESFAVKEKSRGGVESRADTLPYCGTGSDTAGNSLDYATQCNCSVGPHCTLQCVEYSQATDWQACCG